MNRKPKRAAMFVRAGDQQPYSAALLRAIEKLHAELPEPDRHLGLVVEHVGPNGEDVTRPADRRAGEALLEGMGRVAATLRVEHERECTDLLLAQLKMERLGITRPWRCHCTTPRVTFARPIAPDAAAPPPSAPDDSPAGS